MIKYKTKYGNRIKQRAYINACDCLRFGYTMDMWDDCGIDEAERNEIWLQARMDFARV